MRPFIIHSTLFLIPILLALMAVEILYTSVPNEYSLKHKVLSNSSDSLEAIILGPSGTLRGLNPQFFEPTTYNASLRGVDLEIANCVLETALNHQDSLKDVILSVTFNDFHQNARSLNAPGMVYFHKYFDFPGLYTFIGQERGMEMLRKTYGYYVKGKIADSGIQANGFRVFRRRQNAPFDLKAKRIAGNMSRPHPEFVDLNRGVLEDMADRCRDRGIRLWLVALPMHESFLPYVNPGQLEAVHGICQSIEAQYDNVTFVDWLQHEAFSDEHFQDPIHLNEKGAVIASTMMNARLIAVDK